MHEDFTRDDEIKGSSERSLGIVFAIFFALLGAMPLFRHPAAAMRLWAFAIALVFLILAFLRPALLRPVNRLWQRLGMLLHKVVTPVILGFLFYSTVTPIALVLRAAGKDMLRLKKDAKAASYWIGRDTSVIASDMMKNQF